MGRPSGFAVVVAAAALAIPEVASADVFKLFGELHGGGMYGKGTAGDLKSSAFFDQAHGAAYGVLAGAEFLFLDAWIQHHQYINGDGLKTWTQFGVGVHFSVDMGNAEDIKAHKSGYFELGAGLFYGIATGAQVMPPLDKAQVTDQGFLGEGRIGLGKHLSNIFDFGLEVPVTYGYFFRDSVGAANNLSTHYRGFAVEGLLALRANIKLF
jgi:hypothetical protein